MAQFNLDMEIEPDVVKNPLDNFLSMSSNFGIIVMLYFWTHNNLGRQKKSMFLVWNIWYCGLKNDVDQNKLLGSKLSWYVSIIIGHNMQSPA